METGRSPSAVEFRWLICINTWGRGPWLRDNIRRDLSWNETDEFCAAVLREIWSLGKRSSGDDIHNCWSPLTFWLRASTCELQRRLLGSKARSAWISIQSKESTQRWKLNFRSVARNHKVLYSLKADSAQLVVHVAQLWKLFFPSTINSFNCFSYTVYW